MRLPSAADRATATAILLQGVAAIALLGLAFNSDKVIALVANSDALLPAALIFDIRHHPEVWMTFQFPRVPSLVPDLLIYGAVQLATDSWRAAAFAYAVVASLAMTAAAGLIAARLAGVRPMPAAGAFLTLAMLLLGLEWWTDAPPMLWYIVVPVFHGGPFVMALGGLLLALGLFECRGRAGGLLLLTAVSACGALSDKMFVGELTLPLLGALGWLARRGQLGRRRVSVIAGAVLAGTALGFAADHVIFSTVLARQPDVPLEWGVFVSRAAGFLHGPYLGLILGSNALVLTAPLVLRRLRGTEPDDGRVLRFFAVAAAATVVPTTLLAAILYYDETCLRYLSPVFWWAVIFLAALVVRLAGRAASQFALVAPGLLLAAVAAADTALGQALPRLFAWHDPLQVCLDAARTRLGLHAGLAEYWVARRLAASSDWRLDVQQVDLGGEANTWGNNPVWFARDPNDPSKPRAFDFLVTDDIDPEELASGYPQPDSILPCGTSRIWVFHPPERLTALFVKHSSSLQAVFGAADAPVCLAPEDFDSDEGEAEQARLDVSWQAKPTGIIADSPGVDLPAGQWRLTLHYRLAQDGRGSAHWELAEDDGLRRLQRHKLPRTGRVVGAVSTTFKVARYARRVKIRALPDGSGRLEVFGAEFSRIDQPVKGRCPWDPER